MVTTSNCYFYSQLVYGKGHWTSWFLLLSYGVEARSIYFIKATMRTDYGYAVQLNRSTTLVSTAFAIVLRHKTFAHCHFSHMFSSRSHLQNLLWCSYLTAGFFSSWPRKWSEQFFPPKERNYRCAEVQLRYQHRQRQLCPCAHPYNRPEKKLRS